MATKSPNEGQVKPDVGDTLIVIREYPQCGRVGGLRSK